MNWLISNPKLLLIFVNSIAFLALEVCARLLAYNGLIPFKHYPTESQRVLSDINPHFGIWRHPNRSVRHRGACFDVEYSTNIQGMRDRSRIEDSLHDNRIVVLGDSFVEGFGVEADQRLTDIAEKKSGKEFLNFGISGDFSSTQEYLLYREVAAKFDHDSVALFLLPSNDFTDNDPEYFEKSRYRPYLRKDENKYEVYYTTSFKDRKQPAPMSAFRKFRRELYNNIYLFNAIRQFGDLFQSSELKDKITDPFLTSVDNSYDDYSSDDFDKLTWGYKQIAKLSYPRKLHIFIIPREVDFATPQKDSLLTDALMDFAAEHDNIQIHDLLPHFKNYLEKHNLDEDDIFLDCDGHWSHLGHSIAASVLLEALKA